MLEVCLLVGQSTFEGDVLVDFAGGLHVEPCLRGVPYLHRQWTSGQWLAKVVNRDVVGT